MVGGRGARRSAASWALRALRVEHFTVARWKHEGAVMLLSTPVATTR